MKNALLVTLGIVGALCLGTGISTMSFYNGAVSQEKGIIATWRDSQVQYDTFWKTVKEQAQITDKYAADFKEIFLKSIDGRYKGKDPAMSFIMEKNPGLDAAMYQQLARTVEAGRKNFSRTQRTLVDRQREYETTLAKFPNFMLADSFGFPNAVHGEDAPANDRDGDGIKTVLDYGTITSAKTQDVFATGREDDALNVFGD